MSRDGRIYLPSRFPGASNDGLWAGRYNSQVMEPCRIQLSKPTIDNQLNFSEIISSSIGGVVVKGYTMTEPKGKLTSLENELANRIPFSWLSTNSVTRKRLTLVKESSNKSFRCQFLRGLVGRR